jgi:hypothetical protein
MQSMPGSYSPTPVSSTATFGVELGAQMVRDGTEIPKVVEKCAEAIEMFGGYWGKCRNREWRLTNRLAVPSQASSQRASIDCQALRRRYKS